MLFCHKMGSKVQCPSVSMSKLYENTNKWINKREWKKTHWYQGMWTFQRVSNSLTGYLSACLA